MMNFGMKDLEDQGKHDLRAGEIGNKRSVVFCNVEDIR